MERTPSNELEVFAGCQTKAAGSESNLAVGIPLVEIEAIDHCTLPIGSGVHVGLLIDSEESSGREIGFETTISRHAILLRFANFRVGMGAADPEVSACRGIPPKHQSVAIVGAQIDMDV